MSQYKLVGTTNPNTNWNAVLILKGEGENAGPIEVKLGNPVELTDKQKSEVEALGFVLATVSKEEAKAHKSKNDESVVKAADDVAGSGPVFSPSKSSQKG